ncbi:DNA-binding protein [Candidatus Berkelbacteria bacterium CG_4_9_14_3_um_filter_39_23]|uniref:DNA-binding protein n=1 Tax=Candidatus Berkelbacteria bacterium CG_4_9_14_3_um_filter_39_23 TaxID=1974508 RepID=A0A2M8C521_9BACT|nr:MAG: hypothetical protein AUK14_03075 [Candidatus Berkelbacteria bacterium CG2_30_39_44]PIR27734.1 MAG: DNA-binding protein [Candidatus Berkelbacteria bacterium CG11_big_fil_rev_8_21_14_0_20_40_23]PIZ28716.1 MAG: DNA-binding protein [Candidatus Berkelbacteria bacterium CG_4_10_14_0_8_um_filter_39_42]PJB51235.1 MAG: DNA-binding protein [Candidatus Berkelbacteria bacterium CG_4_9_14_3_um_filter_39_23]
MNLQDKIQFWENGAKEDFEFAEKLLKDKNYLWSLFIIQLSLEKALKARVLEKTKKESPKIHDLVRLSLIAGLHTTKEQKREMEIVTGFNIEARYTDYKQGLKQKATFNYAKRYFNKSKEYLKWFLKKN